MLGFPHEIEAIVPFHRMSRKKESADTVITSAHHDTTAACNLSRSGYELAGEPKMGRKRSVLRSLFPSAHSEPAKQNHPHVSSPSNPSLNGARIYASTTGKAVSLTEPERPSVPSYHRPSRCYSTADVSEAAYDKFDFGFTNDSEGDDPGHHSAISSQQHSPSSSPSPLSISSTEIRETGAPSGPGVDLTNYYPNDSEALLILAKRPDPFPLVDDLYTRTRRQISYDYNIKNSSLTQHPCTHHLPKATHWANSLFHDEDIHYYDVFLETRIRSPEYVANERARLTNLWHACKKKEFAGVELPLFEMPHQIERKREMLDAHVVKQLEQSRQLVSKKQDEFKALEAQKLERLDQLVTTATDTSQDTTIQKLEEAQKFTTRKLEEAGKLVPLWLEEYQRHTTGFQLSNYPNFHEELHTTANNVIPEASKPLIARQVSITRINNALTNPNDNPKAIRMVDHRSRAILPVRPHKAPPIARSCIMRSKATSGHAAVSDVSAVNSGQGVHESNHTMNNPTMPRKQAASNHHSRLKRQPHGSRLERSRFAFDAPSF